MRVLCYASEIEPVKVDVRPGDVVLFRGSSIYHERVNAANTTLLYLKFNSMRLDPIGEDPSTPVQREVSLNILSNKSDEQLLDSVIEVSPKLERISRHYTRLYWKEVIQAYVLRKIVADARRQLKDLREAVISVPAYFE